jgi:inositol hexakisphosphate/diphosphoinositol-pentakisphosphate kinase
LFHDIAVAARWGKLQKDFQNKGNFDISKIPDIYDCIKYDIQHNLHAIGFDQAEELYLYSKSLADVIIPQVTKLANR